MILDTRPNTARAMDSATRMQANTEALLTTISEHKELVGTIRTERHTQASTCSLAKGMTEPSGKYLDAALPVAETASAEVLSGHLGTLVRHSRSGTLEVRFSFENDVLVIVATRASKPVSLDFNPTVKELVELGENIFARSVWLRKNGRLVRAN